MQPISRFVPRLLFDSIPLSKPLRSFRPSNRPSLKQSSFSICLQCKIKSQSQTRLFADSAKPPSQSSSNSIPLPPPQDNSLHANTNTYLSSDQHEDVTNDLPSTADERRSAINQRFSHLMDNMQGNIFLASQRINDLTGYSGIEALKARIVALEKRVQDAQDAVRSSRLKYKTTVADRAATQREVTTLLARKDSWNPLDLERFTSLYRMDHTNEQAVQEAATKLAEAEREAEVAAGKLSSSILSRYHEEQIWSDKIRRMSTWGTWGLMGVNVLLFLVFQFGFEPWRRARLVHGFEEKVKEALDKERGERISRRNAAEIEGVVPIQALLVDGTQELEVSAEAQKPPTVDTIIACIDQVFDEEEEKAIVETKAVVGPQEPTTTITKIKNLWQPESWKAEAQDLFSPRQIQMRKQDVTIIALEGVATGAIIAIIATFFRPS